MDFLNEVGFDEADEALRKIKDPNEIWKFIYPTEIYVCRRAYQEQDIYVQEKMPKAFGTSGYAGSYVNL